VPEYKGVESVSESGTGQPAERQGDGDRWRWLYRLSAIGALFSVVIIPISIVAFFIWPPWPDDILVVLQQDRLAGLMALDLLYLLGNCVAIPLFLVLYVTLRRVDEGWALLALVLGLIGLVCIIASRPILEMVALSDGYAAATTETGRATYLAASEAVMSIFHGTAFNVHYVLGSLSLLISSFLMLRSDIYSRATAYVGIVTNVVVFGLYVPVVGVFISLLSVLGYIIWYLLIARRLLKLGWGSDGR
jgi:hypothetical protein